MDASTPTRTSPSKWYHNIWLVLLMLFFVLGPLGLPLLWQSPKFSKFTKILLTLATLAYTWWLIIATLAATRTAMQHFQNLQSVF